MQEDAKPWVAESAYDLETGEVLFREGRDRRVIFFCQQAVEKRLKGLLVHQTGEMPLRTHDLLRLANAVGMNPPTERQAFMKDLSDYYIESRYPEAGLLEAPPREKVREYLDRTSELLSWCDQQMR